MPRPLLCRLFQWVGLVFALDPRLNSPSSYQAYVDGLVQDRRNSIADALDVRLSCYKSLDVMLFIFNNNE